MSSVYGSRGTAKRGCVYEAGTFGCGMRSLRLRLRLLAVTVAGVRVVGSFITGKISENSGSDRAFVGSDRKRDHLPWNDRDDDHLLLEGEGNWGDRQSSSSMTQLKGYKVACT